MRNHMIVRKTMAILLAVLTGWNTVQMLPVAVMAKNVGYMDAAESRVKDQEECKLAAESENTGEIPPVLQVEDITVTPVKESYDGKEKEAVSVTGYKSGDKVLYKTGNQSWTDIVPKIVAVGQYDVSVKVEREGYEPFETMVTSEIKKGLIEITVESEHDYTDAEQNLVNITGGVQRTDIITYKLGDGEFSDTVPKAKNTGSYEVTIRIHRDDNYEDFEKTYQAKINATDITGLSAVLYSGTYDAKEHKAVENIKGFKSGDIVEYKKNDEDWSEKEPVVKDAGKYTIQIRVTRTNYNVTTVEMLDPAVVEIKKAKQSLEFTESYEDKTYVDVTYVEQDIVKDFSVNGNLAGNPVAYSLEKGQDDTTPIDEIATLDASGKLTIKSGGHYIRLIAKTEGNDNYEAAEIVCGVKIQNGKPNLLFFEKAEVTYTVNTDTTVSLQKAKKADDKNDNGEVTYALHTGNDSVQGIEEAIQINDTTGEVRVVNYQKLCKLLENKEDLCITVTATKSEGKKKPKRWWNWWPDRDDGVIFARATATYQIKIQYAQDMPQDVYEISEADGNHGWYKTNPTITVTDKEMYAVAWEFAQNGSLDFSEKIELTTEGTNSYTMYICNRQTGDIYTPVKTDASLDTSSPYAISIQYEEDESLAAKIKTLFFKKVKVTFRATDDVSGIEKFRWVYKRDDDASRQNLESASGEITELEKNDGYWTGSVVLPEADVKLMRGKFSVTVTDIAGNQTEKNENEPTVVADQVTPESQFMHGSTDENTYAHEFNGQFYYNTDVNCKFVITETNFDNAKDAWITVEKDGKPDVALTGQINEKTDWTDGEGDQHIKAFTLTEEGDYVIGLKYTDPSGNEMAAYYSDMIIVDKTKPELAFSYADFRDTQDPQTAIFTVKEHNFCPSDLVVESVVRDINGNDIDKNEDMQNVLKDFLHDGSSWETDTKDPEVHRIKVSAQFIDAVYKIVLNYKDLARNAADECNTGEFIVDHTAPDVQDMHISYSLPLLKSVFSGITFGYYNPDVTVTFEAKDPVSGVKEFDWTYMKEESSSAVNTEKYEHNEKLQAVQDAKDKSRFTASVTLPKEQAEQLRGSIAFTATDIYENTSSGKSDDNTVIVVDTIAPQLQVAYTKASNTTGNTSYYNKPVTATFTVDEANFYPEDVKVSFSKDGIWQQPTAAQLNWENTSDDMYQASWTLPAPDDHSGDGDYIFHVTYTDRSKNQMTEYTSDLLVIDTIQPVIQVKYANTTPKNTLKDAQGHDREYFDRTQTATITVTEHNFAAEDVDFDIAAKDVSGKTIDIDRVCRKSAWVTEGDVHTMTITYPGDANYVFDVAYTDLATNQAADYKKDYFTVDQTAPTNLKVEYSKSVLDTVLSKVTFGFYDAKMRVTISADDAVSGVHAFAYSYLKAAGVSSVNAQLVNQAIKEAQIAFSNDGKTATAKFDIPKAALGKHNQFNGTVEFTATDRAENTSDKMKAKKNIVVDNIAPTASVEYNAPVKTVNGIAYYDGTINATINVNEANFYAEDVKVSVKKDKKAYNIKPAWSNRGTDTHIGTFSLKEDGDYFVTVEYNDKSGNKMATYTSDQLTVDTKMEAPVITINGEDGNGKAYKEDVVPAVSFSDTNFESYQVKLTRTRYDKKDEDVTATYIGNAVRTNGQGGAGTFDTFKKAADTDGIYTLTVSMTDKAGHQAESTTVFTVNRFGSVYVYGDYLNSLIKDGGAYIQETKEDLVITEYNADKLVAGSLRIDVSRNGKPLDEVKYTVTPEINDTVAVGSSGWYQYQYTIDKSNFAADGVYKISVSSKDATGNAPETTNYEEQNILFRVDATAPELTSVTGLENAIVNAQNLTVTYNAYDTIGLASIEIIVNGNVVETITDFAEDLSNYTGSFTLDEQNGAQSVQIVVKDLAGNITDTSTESYQEGCAYVFHDELTVSTNAFVRAMAWVQQHVVAVVASVAVVVALIGSLIFLIGKKRKKKEEK